MTALAIPARYRWRLAHGIARTKGREAGFDPGSLLPHGLLERAAHLTGDDRLTVPLETALGACGPRYPRTGRPLIGFSGEMHARRLLSEAWRESLGVRWDDAATQRRRAAVILNAWSPRP